MKAALARDGVPLVMIGFLETEGVCTIDIDNQAAARAMVEHLIDLGHRGIACITNSPASYAASADRLAGYHETIETRLVIRESTARPGRGAAAHG